MSSLRNGQSSMRCAFAISIATMRRHLVQVASPCVAVMTDHGSAEGSGEVIEAAAGELVGKPPVALDARSFMTGGTGRGQASPGLLTLHIDEHDRPITPDVVILYDIPPQDRWRIGPFQALLRTSGVSCVGADDRRAWSNATDKRRTVARFARDRIPHAETIVMAPAPAPAGGALDAFAHLGRDVWTRPAIGLGGRDVFRVKTPARLLEVRDYYASTRQEWLISRDAQNVDAHGRRHQFRVVVLDDRVLRVCEQVQPDPDLPCNEARGAHSTVLPVRSLRPMFAKLAISATRSLGLRLGGVDLCVEHGGLVFEVNVHPVLRVPGGLETVAIPLVEAHLEAR